jgi:hypothetical protein
VRRDGVGGVDDHLVEPGRRHCRHSVALERAQLAALRIGQDGPPETGLRRRKDHRGSQREDGFDRPDVEVEVHALLDGPRLGDGIDPDRLLRRGPAKGRVTVVMELDLEAEEGAPELRHAMRVGGVDAEVLPPGDRHQASPSCRRMSPGLK